MAKKIYCCKIEIVSLQSNGQACLYFRMTDKSKVCKKVFTILVEKGKIKYDPATKVLWFCFSRDGHTSWWDLLLRAKEHNWRIKMCTDGVNVTGFVVG